jgi:hypothetical protein
MTGLHGLDSSHHFLNGLRIVNTDVKCNRNNLRATAISGWVSETPTPQQASGIRRDETGKNQHGTDTGSRKMTADICRPSLPGLLPLISSRKFRHGPAP